MTILLSAGGTGGHILPLLAVAHELKSVDPSLQVHVISERNGKFSSLLEDCNDIDRVYYVHAGKFRRHHDETILQRLLDVRTNAYNIRDLFKCFVGLVQSLRLIRRINPDVMFSKGGFVVVPVGLAAAAHKVPIITHDSDTLPGLANRILSKWVTVHATGMPKKYYDYPKKSTQYVGVPVASDYSNVTSVQQATAKRKLGIPASDLLILVTGGSQGSKRLNTTVVLIAQQLFKDNPSLRIIHQTGKGRLKDYRGYSNERLQVVEFLQNMHIYSAAADIVVTQASATTLVELAAQKKAVISLPSPHLAGGHQLKNAKHLEETGSAMVIKPAQLEVVGQELYKCLTRLLRSQKMRIEIGNRLHDSFKLDASNTLAGIILAVAKYEV